MALPQRIKSKSDKAERGKRSPAHRSWVRGFACSACGSTEAIEVAHVRRGTDGGMGIKPSDKWTISLCKSCHAQQHQQGEETFEKCHGIDMKVLAMEFFKASPHRQKLETKEGD